MLRHLDDAVIDAVHRLGTVSSSDELHATLRDQGVRVTHSEVIASIWRLVDGPALVLTRDFKLKVGSHVA